MESENVSFCLKILSGHFDKLIRRPPGLLCVCVCVFKGGEKKTLEKECFLSIFGPCWIFLRSFFPLNMLSQMSNRLSDFWLFSLEKKCYSLNFWTLLDFLSKALDNLIWPGHHSCISWISIFLGNRIFNKLCLYSKAFVIFKGNLKISRFSRSNCSSFKSASSAI